MVRVDAVKGTLDAVGVDLTTRPVATPDLSANGFGMGREMFEIFRQTAGNAEHGAGVVV